MNIRKNLIILSSLSLLISGCTSVVLPQSKMKSPAVNEYGAYVYRIGTGDIISIFVWGNEDISGDYSVRPDGFISMALTDAVIAAGKTAVELEEVLEKKLSSFIKNPKLTVIIKTAAGNLIEQVKVIGDATTPASFAYSKDMTLLDLMIKMGGLSRFADGNSAILIRIDDGKLVEYPIRIEDLMEDADLSANVDLKPGDVVRIPEAWF